MFLHEGDVLFGEYYAVNTMDPHMVGSAVLWPADPGTGEILGQITINTNTSITDSVTGHGDGAGGVLGWPQQRVDAVFTPWSATSQAPRKNSSTL